MGTIGWRLDWWVSGVKSVTVDFWAESCSPLPCAQAETSSVCLASVAAATSTRRSEAVAVKSSAYEVHRGEVSG